MKLNIENSKYIKPQKITKYQNNDNEKYLRDSITHIFGTFDNNKKKLTYIGFKCVSGKTEFYGKPEGEGFIFGVFGQKFHQIKLQMTDNGINKLETFFNENPKTNYYLQNKKFDNIDEDEFILDEKELINVEDDPILINKLITTPLLEDEYFFDKNNKDEICGNDYKEVVNQTPRFWIINNNLKTSNNQQIKNLLTVNDALQEYDEENLKRNSKYQYANANNNLRLRQKSRKLKKLHKKRKLNDNLNEPKWNGEIDNNLNYNLFIKNYDNYNQLKNELAQNIQSDFMEIHQDNNLSNNSETKQALLEQIIPEIAYYQGKNKTNLNEQISSLEQKEYKFKKKKTLKQINYKGEEIIYEENKNNNDDQKNKDQIYYSDALKIFDDLSDIKDGNQDNLFGFGNSENYFPKENKIILRAVNNDNLSNNLPRIKQNSSNNHSYYSYNACSKNNSKTNSSRNSIKNQKAIIKQKYVYDPAKYKIAQEKWKNFNNKLKKLNGVYLLQTIYSIIKALKIINNDDKLKNISLAEKIKLLKLLEENGSIVNLLSQTYIKRAEEQNKKKEDEEEEEEDILIPDENPEQITSLPELEQKLNDVNNLLKNKNLTEDQLKKLEKLKNFFLQQKNILIENETNKLKKQLIKENNINLNQLINQEQTKRNNAEKETQKLINEQEKSQTITKKTSEISIKSQKNPKKIYAHQKMYTGTDPWIDPLFPPEKKSLCPYDSKGWIYPEGVSKDYVTGWQYYTWHRASELLKTENYNVFEDGASNEDIIQGSLGDCYFLSVIGSLCKFPKIIDKLFYTKEKTKEHIYGIYFYINGVWKLVLVDDFLPAYGSNFKKIAFGYSNTKELWVSLLEKAWAKINGSYAKITIGGLTNEVFDVLTEAYTQLITINPKQKNDLWDKIYESEKKGFVMTAGTSKNRTGGRLENVGLKPGHAYTILGVYEFENEGKIKKIMKLRNPYGFFEYSGDWGDSSSKWTDELKKKFEIEKKNDGIFFMAFDDFIKYFTTMGFAKLHQDYFTSFIDIKKEEATKCQLIKINVNENNVHSYIQLYQKNPRIILKDGTFQKTALCFLLLVDKNFNYLTSISSNKMHIAIEYQLNKGEYYIFCDVNYRYIGKNHNYTVTTYAEKEIMFENVTNVLNMGECLRKVMSKYAKTKAKKVNKNDIDVYVTNMFNDDFPFSVAYFENNTANNMEVNIEVKKRAVKSFCFYCDDIASEEDEKVTKDLDSNGNCVAIIMKYTLSSLYNFSYSFKKPSEKKNEIKKPEKEKSEIEKPENEKFVIEKPENEKPVIKEPEIKNTENENKKQETKKPEANKQVIKQEENKGPNSETKKETKPVIIKPISNNKNNEKTKIPSKNNNKKKEDNNEKVFEEKGEPIKDNNNLIQYVMKKENGYVIGLENKTNKKLRLKLNIKGLELTDAMYKGRDNPIFFIDPKGKKIFNSIIKDKFEGDHYSFEFQLM